MSRIPSASPGGRRHPDLRRLARSACRGTSRPTTSSTSRRPPGSSTRTTTASRRSRSASSSTSRCARSRTRSAARSSRSSDRPASARRRSARAIARAMGRKFVRMSLGGIHDEAEIRGHRRTYIGALPGRIIQNIKTAGSNNPVFMLDEVDKIGMDFRGDPSSALLEVLDPEQNNSFQDNYLEVPFDLSKVLFIATANLLDPIPAPLRDRMEIVQLPGYTAAGEDRDRQAVPHPQADGEPRPQAEEHRDHRRGDDRARPARTPTRRASGTSSARSPTSCARSPGRSPRAASARPSSTSKKLDEYLGPPRFEYGELEAEDQIGLRDRPRRDRGRRRRRRDRGHPDGRQGGLHPHRPARRGDARVRPCRPVVDPGPRPELGIEREVFEKNTLHIHVPAGAIPKDGPSAGITMATAMVSALTGIPVRKDVAMTGEITLRGRVLPIGGLKSKILAAHLAGAKIVILPRKNEKDLRDIPEEIRKSIKLDPRRLDGAGARGGPPAQAEAARRRARRRSSRATPRSIRSPAPRVRRSDFPPTDQPPVVVRGS